MVIPNTTEQRDEQVVASKLPRSEFANFKKVCDIEGKTPSKKIRDLINKEVNDKFENIYKSRYDLEKIKYFQISALQDYNDSQIIDKICKVNFVERTDGKFVQIGFRPLIEEDIFLKEGNVHPELPSLGRDIALGEVDFLVKSLLQNEKIENIHFNESIKEFPKHIDSNATVILLSTKFYVEVFTQLMHRIDYEQKYPRLDKRHQILSISERIMGNKIIILDKESVLWTKQKFYNEFSGKDEALDILVEPDIGWKANVLVRSVNKIKDIDENKIKILEIEK